MALVVPFLAAAGGGSVAAGAAVVAATAATVGSGVMSAVQARNAGIAQNQAAKAAARQEADAARDREIDRRKSLLEALSSQNAVAGAQGVSLTGSKAAIAQKDINDANADLLRDKVNSKRAINMYRTQGRNAQAAGNLGAATSLVDTVGNTAKIYL